MSGAGFDWNGDDGVRYEASDIRNGFLCGARTDVDYARACRARYVALSERNPQLAWELMGAWARMMRRRFGGAV